MSEEHLLTEGDSLLICGWSPQGRRMVLDILAVSPSIAITVVCECRAAGCPSVVEHPEITHINGDPTDSKTLLEAGLESAEIVVLLTDRGHGGPSQTLDARTILAALTIRKLSASSHIIAELFSERNVELAESAGIDEWILTDQYSGVMLSQSLQSPGLSELFTQLFETGAGSALRQVPVPDGLIGTRFCEAATEAIARGLGALAGFRRGDELHLPPGDDLVLAEGDQLLLLQRIGTTRLALR